MIQMRISPLSFSFAIILCVAPNVGFAQAKKLAAVPKAAVPQKQDEEYGKLIREYLQDSRITT